MEVMRTVEGIVVISRTIINLGYRSHRLMTRSLKSERLEIK